MGAIAKTVVAPSGFAAFRNMMMKARKGQRIPYHEGNLAEDRVTDGQVDLIARFAKALYELDTARLYHEGNKYYVVLTRRLRVRRDEQGTAQEAERLMEIL